MSATLERDRERARQVQLLGRVEAARERRCQDAAAVAKAAHDLAIGRRADAEGEAASAESRRQLSLRALYGALPGSRRAVGIHDLRNTEKALRTAELIARKAAEAARQAEAAAGHALREAEQALREAAARRQRRERLGDQLIRAHRLAADSLADELVADELADRAAAGASRR